MAALQAAGLPVIGYDLMPTPGLANDHCVLGNLADLGLLERWSRNARCIIHLAATPDDIHYPRGEHGDNFLNELVPNNIVGTYHVMEAGRKARVPRVILASTGQVIAGHLEENDVPVDGSSAPKPRYLYACTKVFLEALGQVYAREHDMEVIAVRLGWCPRPGQEEEFARSPYGPDVYLSPGDAGRFFLAAVQAEHLPQFSILYATSRPAKRVLFGLGDAARLLGYVPQDRFFVAGH